MKSKINKIQEIKYDKEFVIKQLYADPKMLKLHEERLKSLLPKDTPEEEIKKRIHIMVVKENSFNIVMEYLSKLYKYDISDEESKNIFKKITNQFKLDAEKDAEKIKNISEKIIIKSLIFEEFAKEKSITVSDQEAKEYLEKYYKETNQPINDLLKSSEKFNEVKEIILEEKITDFLLKSFKFKIELEK